VTTDPLTAVRSPREPLVAAVDSTTSERRLRSGITISVEPLAWTAVIAIAALFRLLDLGLRPLRPEEGLRARAALDFSTGVVSPDWFGDLTSGLTVLVFRLFGDTDVTARLVPALLGVAAVACLALYRPLIGRGAALIGGLLLAVSPVAVAGARSFGPEAAALPLALLMPPLAWRTFLDGRRSLLPLLTLVVGFGLGTGSLVPAVGVILVAWFAVEFGWLDARASSDRSRAEPWNRRLLLLAALALLPGVLLAMTRYGAGFDRLTLSAVRAWELPLPVVAVHQPWTWVPAVLVAYEPLITALGLAGAVIAVRRWTQPDAFGGRLLLLWAGIGLAINLIWLRNDPAQLLVTTVPLAMLAGVATASASRCLVTGKIGRLIFAVIPLAATLGFTLAMLVEWGNFQRIPAGEAISVGLVLLGGIVATAALVWLLRVPAAAALLLCAWFLLGALTLHASSNLAFDGGSEFLFGRRTLPQVAAVDRSLDRIADPTETVAIERRLWPALAWPLRDRPATLFVVSPPTHPAVLPMSDNIAAAPSPAQLTPVTEQWTPFEWDLIGILRWWIFRTPWGPVTIQQPEVQP
jgi:hypothetical protein